MRDDEGVRSDSVMSDCDDVMSDECGWWGDEEEEEEGRSTQCLPAETET